MAIMSAEFPLRDDFELGGWTVRSTRLILEREGEVVHVKPKTMEVLVALAESAGDVLSRDRLLEKVWHNAYVSDDVLTQAIAELRRAFQDDCRHPNFIETVPRRGYRLIQRLRSQPRDLLIRSAPVARSGDVISEPWPRPVGRFATAAIAAVALVSVGWLLVGTSPQFPVDPRPTDDTEAYELYLTARQTFQPHRSAVGQMEEALGMVRRAVERDPGFAQAHALIAEIQTFRGFWNQEVHDEALSEARKAAKAALEIDPGLSYPHAVAGLATAVLDWKWEEGYRQAIRATELDPNDGRSLSLRAVLSLTRGKPGEAVRLAYRAYELNPIDPHALGILSWVLYQARHYDASAAFMAKTVDVDPEAHFARNFRPLALAYAGRYQEALDAERARPVDGPGASAHRENLPLILILAGRQEEARRHLLQLDISRGPVETAWGYLGEKEIVFERLERMVQKRMTNYLMWLRTEPAWDPVRDAPRFQDVLERVGLTG